ncbi:MAG: class I tRNA ligase family protein, partial [Nitrospira sp.]|nr:class I tRNA ligase family protein [Nitrospira sp.]
ERLINWCPRCQTALSDIEVEHEETLGKMYYIKYSLAEDPEKFLTVATTRPETMLGDTAVAVHPEDPRYKHLLAQKKEIKLPLTTKTIPIVGDSILVDREFGTGAVKITPGHDFNDEKAGQRHHLLTISLLDQAGRMDGAALSQEAKVRSEFIKDLALKSVHEARKLVVQWLEQEGHLIKIEDHRYAIGKCYRCKTVVEPYRSPQWFVKVNDPQNSLAQPAIEAVRSGHIRMIPETWKNNYFGWMENIQDWCISRQIWWGHQIPAWYCKQCDKDVFKATDTIMVIGVNAKPIVQTGAPKKCPHCGSTDLIQDPDVLDTWFSSALWPFSTLGWPKTTQEL